MFATLTFIILAIGTTYKLEDATATSLTFGKTYDNRVRITNVQFADGLTCFTPKVDWLSYNTVADATAANPVPFETKRGFQYMTITTKDCIAMMDNPTTESLLYILLILVGIIVDAVVWVCIYKSWKDGRRQVRPTATPVVVVPQVTAAPKGPQPQQQPALTTYAATLMIEAAIRRGDTCPVTLAPLTSVALLVPPCGHILSEAARPTNNMCPVCRAPATYTPVPCKLTVEQLPV